MRVLQAIAVFMIFAVMTIAMMFFVIGAVLGVAAIVTEARTTIYEDFSMIMVMILGGVIGAVLFVEDTK